MSLFQKASKARKKLRLGLAGPSGSGKTYTALALATGLGGPVAVIDTEHGSASLYSDDFDFDTVELPSSDPRVYIEHIKAAEVAGYNVLVIDSFSHAWAGKEGVLAQVDNIAKKSGSGNTFAAWRHVTPLHNALVDAILGCKCHLIATLRSHTDYAMEMDPRTGKTSPRKIGLKPVQRDGMEYEFDIVGDLNLEHELIITKTRCRTLDGQVFSKPGRDVATTILGWLNSGTEPAPAVRTELDPDIKDCLIALIAQAGISPDGVRKSLEARGVQAIAHLSNVQAGQMIELLKERIRMRAAQGEAAAPPPDQHPVSADFLDRMEVEGEIMMGLQQLGDASTRLASFLGDYEASKLSDLTDGELKNLAERVQGRLAADTKTPANAEDFTIGGGDRPVRS
jgi:DNA polymerase III delta prime subunit